MFSVRGLGSMVSPPKEKVLQLEFEVTTGNPEINTWLRA